MNFTTVVVSQAFHVLPTILKSTHMYILNFVVKSFWLKMQFWGMKSFETLFNFKMHFYILSFQSFLKCLYFQNINHNPLSSFVSIWLSPANNNVPTSITYWFHYPKPKILSRDFLVFPMGFSLLRTTHTHSPQRIYTLHTGF